MATLLFGQALFDDLTARARAAPRRRTNVNFHPSADFPAHRFLVAMEPETYVRPHRHTGSHKDETLVALRGRFGLLVFDAQGNVTTHAVLAPDSEHSGANIAAGTFHSTVALESGAIIMEAKAGPYEPTTDKDWGPWAPPEGSAGAQDYLRVMRGFFA